MCDRLCKKCGTVVPRFIWIDGKKRNCQRRKYCFECSPFGEHNTRQLEGEPFNFKNKKTGLIEKVCPDCNRPHVQPGKRCFCCYFNLQKKRKLIQVEELIGGFKCWICGYDNCKRNIHFHHVDATTKLFGLTTRELMLKWDKVLNEMRKCVLVCSNCHGEIHEGMHEKLVQGLWLAKWKEIGTIP